jgi:hypothetical protein
MRLFDAIERSATAISVAPSTTLRAAGIIAPLRVDYEAGTDLTGIPDSVALVPFILNVAPVVWARGLHVTVPVMEEELAAALVELRDALSRLYPGLAWSGSIEAERLERVPLRPSGDRVALLFSGGLDSVASSLAHLDEPQMLILVRGADVALDNERGWQRVRNDVEAFARRYGHDVTTITSTFRAALDERALQRVHPSITHWWSNVQHGMGLAGLTVPLLVERGIGRLLIASTHTPTFRVAWGSHPTIDNHVASAGVRVEHDLHELSRQDKLRLVIARSEERRADQTNLRVCYAEPEGGGGNCGACEKCLRTMAGLVLEGRDPRRYGFSVSPEVAIARMRRRFDRLVVPFSANARWMWEDIQARARLLQLGAAAYPAYVEWLAGFDFGRYERRYAPIGAWKRSVVGLTKRVPSVHEAARRLARWWSAR